MASKGIGIDEGTSTVKVVEVVKKDGALQPVRAASVAVADDGSYDAAELRQALQAAGIKAGGRVAAGLTGKDLVIRYHQVPAVPEWQLRQIMNFEIQEIERQSGDQLASDFNLLQVSSDLTSDDLVLLALSREQRVEERRKRFEAAKLGASFFTPNSLALYHAFRQLGPETAGDVVVLSVGRTCSDLTILRDGELLYARSVNTGGEVLTDALVEQFNVSREKAEKLKREMGDLHPRDQRKGLTPQQEKVSYALENAAGRLFSMIQSTVQFAKSQIQLNKSEPTKFFITGGSAEMPGLAEYLAKSLGAPVQLFDPLADSGVTITGPATSHEMTIALGLALMAADRDAYSVEVLGRSLLRTRAFKEKHAFTVIGVLLLIAYLGVAFFHQREDFAAAVADNQRVSKEQQKRKNNESRLEELKTARAELASKLDLLEKKKAASESMARTVGLLSQHLPEDLWVQELELDYPEKQASAKQVGAKTPVVLVKGAGKSRGSRKVDESFRQFINAMLGEKDLSGPGQLVEAPSMDRDDFTFSLELNFLRVPEVKAPESDEEGSR